MKAKSLLFQFGLFQVNNGNNVHLWKDKWLRDSPLKLRFMRLFDITSQNQISIREKLCGVQHNIMFQQLIVDLN